MILVTRRRVKGSGCAFSEAVGRMVPVTSFGMVAALKERGMKVQFWKPYGRDETEVVGCEH